MPRKKMYQRPDGLYEKILVINGKRVAFRARSEREVMQKIALYQGQQEKGPSFSQMADEWWAYKEPRLSPNTINGYRVAMQRASDRFGDMPMKEITATQLRGWLDWLGSRGYARKTVANHLIVLSEVFAWACENHNLAANPAAMVHVPDGLAKTKRKMPTAREIEIIKANVDTPDGLFFYFLMYTGLRLGEALALQWKDLDPQKGTIHVWRSLYWPGKNKGEFKPPKTEAGNRDVIYLDRLQAVLEPLREAPDYFVLGQEEPMSKGQYSRLVHRFQKNAGVSCTPHQLRHAFATLCFEAGIPEKTAQGLLGHAQLSTTMDIYAELRDKKRMEAAAALNATDL